MITNCNKCGVAIHWDNSAAPPATSQRAKENKTGWFVEENGSMHTLERCGKNTSTISTTEHEFVVPSVQLDAGMVDASQLVKMAMFEANQIVKTHYPNLANENLRGQIRSKLVDQLLAAYKLTIK